MDEPQYGWLDLKPALLVHKTSLRGRPVQLPTSRGALVDFELESDHLVKVLFRKPWGFLRPFQGTPEVKIIVIISSRYLIFLFQLSSVLIQIFLPKQKLFSIIKSIKGS